MSNVLWRIFGSSITNLLATLSWLATGGLVAVEAITVRQGSPVFWVSFFLLIVSAFSIWACINGFKEEENKAARNALLLFFPVVFISYAILFFYKIPVDQALAGLILGISFLMNFLGVILVLLRKVCGNLLMRIATFAHYFTSENCQH